MRELVSIANERKSLCVRVRGLELRNPHFSLIAEKKLQQILGEKDELSVQREALDQSKSKLDADLNEQRSIKTSTQNENLQLAAAKRAVENDIQIAKVR